MQQSIINDLVLSSQKNDTKAFRKLVEAYQPMVFSLAFRMLCNEDDAKDMVQETFIRIWKKIRTFDNGHNFSTWVYTIATNLCYDQLRKTKRKPIDNHVDQQVLKKFVSEENNEQAIINSELAAIITGLTEELSPKQKLVFTLRDLEGLEIDEIVAITTLSHEKIKSNLFLARQFIRKKINSL